MRQSTVALLVFKLYSTPEHMFLNTGKRSVPGVQIVFFHMYSVHATTVATFPQKHNKVGESLSQCTYESAPLPPPSRPLSPSSLLERRALRARKSFLFSPPSLYFLPTPPLPPPAPSSPSSSSPSSRPLFSLLPPPLLPLPPLISPPSYPVRPLRNELLDPSAYEYAWAGPITRVKCSGNSLYKAADWLITRLCIIPLYLDEILWNS